MKILTVERWNAACPPGTRVRYRLRGGEFRETRTQGEAVVRGDLHMVPVEGQRPGYFTLDELDVVPDDQPSPALPAGGGDMRRVAPADRAESRGQGTIAT